MPVVIACSSCQGKLNIPEKLAGKAIKCPKCGQVIRTPGGDGAATAPPPMVKVQPDPTPAPAPPAAAPIQISCANCQKKLQVKATLAGKAIKCPGCGNVVKVPSPAPPASPAAAEDDWIDINEPYVPAPAAAAVTPDAGPVTGDWGECLMQGHAVSDEMKHEIRDTLRKGERLLWFDRPRVDIMIGQARVTQLLGILIAVGVLAFSYLIVSSVKEVGFVIFMCIFAAAFVAVGIWMTFLPMKVRKGADRRPCYALTNRRLLIHRGKGARIQFQRGAGVQVTSGDDGFGSVIAYTGLELTRMSRLELRRFRGAGELLFGRSALERPYNSALIALNNVRDVERMIREKLINPVMDRLLRGESLALTDKGKLNQTVAGGQDAQGDTLAPDANLKDYVSGRAAAVDPDDPNVKAAPVTARNERAASLYDPNQLPPKQREQVEAELTDGERILWVGKPEGGPPGRGLFGGAYHIEPRYTLYALTNRRVLVWHKWGWKQKKFLGNLSINVADMAWNFWGPQSYYPTALRNSYVEADKRITNGGSIVFKRFKLKWIVKQQGSVIGRGKIVQIYYFGLLHIRNVNAVTRLLYQTLLEPARGL